MNKVMLVGRIVNTPFKNITASKVEFSRFTIAVAREYRGANNEAITDFIPCVAWNNNATFINKYLDKGSLVSIEGSFQSQRFTNDRGETNTAYSVNVDRINSLETREASEARRKSQETREFNIPKSVQTAASAVEESSTNDTSSENPFANLDWDDDLLK